MANAVASTDTCTVACKMPNGIFMQGYKLEDGYEPVLGGGSRPIKVAAPAGPKVKIRGNAAPQGSVAAGITQGDYALTHDVPLETAMAWLEANKDSDLVKNKLILIHAKANDAAAEAKNNHAVKSGLERLDPGTVSQNGRTVPADYRWPKSRNANVADIATADK